MEQYVGKFPFVGQRIMKADKKAMKRNHGPLRHSIVRPGLNYARGKQLTLWFKGSRNVFRLCTCSELGITSAGRNLWFLRWRLSFYKSRMKVPNNLGTNSRLQLCLKTMRETLFPCLEADIRERVALNDVAAFNPRWNCHISQSFQ